MESWLVYWRQRSSHFRKSWIQQPDLGWTWDYMNPQLLLCVNENQESTVDSVCWFTYQSIALHRIICMNNKFQWYVRSKHHCGLPEDVCRMNSRWANRETHLQHQMPKTCCQLNSNSSKTLHLKKRTLRTSRFLSHFNCIAIYSYHFIRMRCCWDCL